MELSSHPVALLLTKHSNVSTSLPLQCNQQHTLVTDAVSWRMQVPTTDEQSDRDVWQMVKLWHHSCNWHNLRLSKKHFVHKSGQGDEAITAVCVSKRAGHTSSLPQCSIDPNWQAPPLTHGMSAGITASVATTQPATFKGFCFMASFCLPTDPFTSVDDVNRWGEKMQHWRQTTEQNPTRRGHINDGKCHIGGIVGTGGEANNTNRENTALGCNQLKIQNG